MSVSQSEEEDYEKNTVGSLPISNNQICNIQVWLTILRIDLSDTDPSLTNLSPLWCPNPPSPNARNVLCNGWDFLFVPPVTSADDQNFVTLTNKNYTSRMVSNFNAQTGRVANLDDSRPLADEFCFGWSDWAVLVIHRERSFSSAVITTFPDLRGSFKKDTCPRHEK